LTLTWPSNLKSVVRHSVLDSTPTPGIRLAPASRPRFRAPIIAIRDRRVCAVRMRR
jgi:hypothetical protein